MRVITLEKILMDVAKDTEPPDRTKFRLLEKILYQILKLVANEENVQ